ncbi:MAG: DUF1844 domain-containing protein [Terrimicrobiaceae bacterium]|jgi:hypothetical protein
MPEVQTSNSSGEMTQRFIELVMMQAQQAAMFLGRMPNPQTGQPEVNLEYARLFIDQLEMIQEKTRGNLSNEEQQMLTGVLSDLRLTFLQASSSAPAPSSPEPLAAAAPEVPPETPAIESEPESRKRFSKSYGS